MGYKYFDEGRTHLHTFEQKPLIGTSSALSIMAVPLHWWALQIGLGTLGYLPARKKVNGKYISNSTDDRVKKAEMFLQEQTFDSAEEWLRMLDTAYYAHEESKDASADRGNRTHKMCEEFIRAHMISQDKLPYTEKDPIIGEFVKWVRLNVKKFLWTEGHCYSKKYWLGGICDAGYESKDGHIGIIDFKSSKEAYLKQYLQCALYDVQISENGVNDRNGNTKLFLPKNSIDHYIVFPFGAEKVEPQVRWDVEQLRVGGLSALNLYKLSEGLTLGSIGKEIIK